VSLFGALFNHYLKNDITTHVGSQAASQLTSGGQLAGLSAKQLATMPSQLVTALLHGISVATSSVFFWAIFVAVLVPVLAVFIKQVPLRSSQPPPDAVTAEEEAAAVVGAFE
jgi:hypothetical protein